MLKNLKFNGFMIRAVKPIRFFIVIITNQGVHTEIF